MGVLNISHIKHCYGCGVCAIICPKNIIKIELNKEGFYEPVLFNDDACTKCGFCLSVCAYNYDKLLDSDNGEPGSYAAWSNDSRIRRKCSSGGIGFELAANLIKQNYKACGVLYNPKLNRAEHFMASTIEEYIPSIGSKYIQSYTLPGLSQLNRNDNFFVTGTPCQIDSLRRYIRRLKIEENFVLMDFFCHGVPSMNMWKKYTEMVEEQTGKITYASWRNKFEDWHNSPVIVINGEKGENSLRNSYEMLIEGEKDFMYISPLNKGDLFFEFFLRDVCLGRACYDKCKYRYDKSAADIRIGDLWGKKYELNEKGVSALLALTDRGKEVISKLNSCTLIKEDISVVTEGQMKIAPKKKFVRKFLMKLFISNIPMKQIYILFKIYLLPKRILYKFRRVTKFKL